MKTNEMKLTIVPPLNPDPFTGRPGTMWGINNGSEAAAIANSEGYAVLFAAAPELLEALIELRLRYVEAIGNEGPECWKAAAAIARATTPTTEGGL